MESWIGLTVSWVGSATFGLSEVDIGDTSTNSGVGTTPGAGTEGACVACAAVSSGVSVSSSPVGGRASTVVPEAEGMRAGVDAF